MYPNHTTFVEQTFPKRHSAVLRDLSLKTRFFKAAETINQLIENKDLNYEESFACLTAVTDKVLLCFNHKKTGLHHFIKEASELLSLGINKTTLAHNISRNESKTVYFEHIDLLIHHYDLSMSKEDKAKLYPVICEDFRDITNVIVSRGDTAQFSGLALKILPPVGDDDSSVAITPEAPNLAVAVLHRQNSRTLFAEYGGKESAECFISEWYGWDGKYARHYHAFLDCKDRYPEQKKMSI